MPGELVARNVALTAVVDLVCALPLAHSIWPAILISVVLGSTSSG